MENAINDHAKRLLGESLQTSIPMNEIKDASDPAWSLASPSKLAEALAKAQAEIKTIIKDNEADIKSEKGSYKYRYANLASGIEAIRGPLSKHGIAHVCQTKMRGETLILYTRLIHESGEFLESEWPVGDPNRLTPQQRGSALTYGRRYTLFGLVGLAAEDDDGEEAAKGTRPQSDTRFYDEAVQLIDSAPTSTTLKEWWNSPEQKSARRDMLDTKAHASLLRVAKEKIAELEAAEKSE